MIMYPEFDTSALQLTPVNLRKSDIGLSDILGLEPKKGFHKNIEAVAEKIVQAKKNGSKVIMMMGAHVLRAGVQKYLIDLMGRGYISCIAMNGACTIHDFEFALIGKTTESVKKYIKDGRFGNWKETGQINDIVRNGSKDGLGLGEAIGKAIQQGDFPHKDISILAAGYRLGVLLTVHVGIGYDITHQHLLHHAGPLFRKYFGSKIWTISFNHISSHILSISWAAKFQAGHHHKTAILDQFSNLFHHICFTRGECWISSDLLWPEGVSVTFNYFFINS